MNNKEKNYYRYIFSERKRAEVNIYVFREIDSFDKRQKYNNEKENNLVERRLSEVDIPYEGFEDRLIMHIMLEEALKKLTNDELHIICELFYYGKKEIEVANEMGVSKSAINKRKHKIFKKIAESIKN